MKIGYITEINETNILIKVLFNIIKKQKFNDKVIYYLPIYKKNKLSERKSKKLVKKLNKLLKKDEIKKVAISKQLNINKIKNNLHSYNIDILNGRILFKYLIEEIIDYICEKKGSKKEFEEISFLINDIDSISSNIIISVAKNIKRLNIITNQIDKFGKLEQYLYNELGIIINVSNNKKSSLAKAKIILNLDFSEENVNSYKIYEKAIIINVLGKIKIDSKRFNGININYYNINMPKEYQMIDFNDEIIYESIILYMEHNLDNIMKKIKTDKITIKNLVGNKGIISEKEFKQML